MHGRLHSKFNDKFANNQSDRLIVTSAQMRAIESLMFAAGMPVEALMEKVAGLIATKIESLYPLSQFPQVGILAGIGHNGGDALVVARELSHQGRDIKICIPNLNHLDRKLKPLTASHWQYLEHLGFSNYQPTELAKCDLIIDGLFGYGLERAIASELADIINEVNSWEIPIVSIDLPSGIHTDTGEVMGTAIEASHTLCLGLWKRGLFIEDALAFIGNLERIDFNIPAQFIQQVLDQEDGQDRHCLSRIEPQEAIAMLSVRRPIATHKYQMGHLLLIGGSQRYAGAVILAALGARATGVGMLSVAVPASLRDLVLAKVPEALIISCPETATGVIAHLPEDVNRNINKYTAIACGVGISLDAINLVEQILLLNPNLVLDADALSLLAQLGIEKLRERSPNSTILTPHWGEFCRLFPLPSQTNPKVDRFKLLEDAARSSGAVILLKGARTAISFDRDRQVQTWINPESTPALARGGSGDVLTGMIGGLLAQNKSLNLSVTDCAIAAAVWHSQTAINLAKQTEMAVNPIALAENLLKLF
jgi:ADP-dependent NAD(P)H-hydrate dehydratase / NAD(P)H-hydrate epimerase